MNDEISAWEFNDDSLIQINPYFKLDAATTKQAFDEQKKQRIEEKKVLKRVSLNSQSRNLLKLRNFNERNTSYMSKVPQSTVEPLQRDFQWTCSNSSKIITKEKSSHKKNEQIHSSHSQMRVNKKIFSSYGLYSTTSIKRCNKYCVQKENKRKRLQKKQSEKIYVNKSFQERRSISGKKVSKMIKDADNRRTDEMLLMNSMKRKLDDEKTNYVYYNMWFL